MNTNGESTQYLNASIGTTIQLNEDSLKEIIDHPSTEGPMPLTCDSKMFVALCEYNWNFVSIKLSHIDIFSVLKLIL